MGHQHTAGLKSQMRAEYSSGARTVLSTYERLANALSAMGCVALSRFRHRRSFLVLAIPQWLSSARGKGTTGSFPLPLCWLGLVLRHVCRSGLLVEYTSLDPLEVPTLYHSPKCKRTLPDVAENRYLRMTGAALPPAIAYIMLKGAACAAAPAPRGLVPNP